MTDADRERAAVIVIGQSAKGIGLLPNERMMIDDIAQALADAEQRGRDEMAREFESIAAEWEIEAKHRVAGTGWRNAHGRCAARIRSILRALADA